MGENSIICGIDEAGRGCLAGPVVSCAVVLPGNFPVEILDDSKKIKPKRRVELASILLQQCIHASLGWAWPEEIDRLNIHHATLLSMQRAFNGIAKNSSIDTVLVDGKFTPKIDRPARAVVRGDQSIPEIQAASILAKTMRDQWIMRYDLMDSRYGFARHKGYATLEHREKIAKFGSSAIQRKSFRISCSFE